MTTDHLTIEPTAIKGCFRIKPKIFRDNRGSFIKVFQRTMFSEIDLPCNFVEQFYTTSKKNVLRGMHFQVPPHEHYKLVYPVVGQVFDVVIDLRKGSPTYGKHDQMVLDSAKAEMLYIPIGLAHGFYTVTDNATLVYLLSSEYSSQNDLGIRWNSLNISWPSSNPVLSERDQKHPSFNEFNSPFSF